MLSKVISGGQNGVDLAGVAAAKVCGIATGGWMPRGWWTLDGSRPAYGPYFGMQQHPEANYPPRTKANVRDSDATIRIASDLQSAGERCTLRAIRQIGKSHMDVSPGERSVEDDIVRITHFLTEARVAVLNVAGNSRKTDPTIGGFAYALLVAVFDRLGHPIQNADLHAYCLSNL